MEPPRSHVVSAARHAELLQINAARRLLSLLDQDSRGFLYFDRDLAGRRVGRRRVEKCLAEVNAERDRILYGFTWDLPTAASMTRVFGRS